MKKIILSSLLIISFGFSLMAQNASTEQLDKALEVKFSEKQIEQLTKDNPKELDYLRYCVYNAYYITDLPKEKLQTSPERIKKIKLNDLENNLKNYYGIGFDVHRLVPKRNLYLGVGNFLGYPCIHFLFFE